MVSVSNAIGQFLEAKLLAHIPDLVDHRTGNNKPDFQWNGVWVEAKAAYCASDYGAIIKAYQVDGHEHFQPLVYAFGYHNFERSMQRLGRFKTMTGAQRHLHNNASIVQLYIVSGSIAEKLWVGHKLLAEKTGIPYCRIPPHVLECLLTNHPVVRRGKTVLPSEYYGIEAVVGASANPLGYVLTPQDVPVVKPLIGNISPALFA